MKKYVVSQEFMDELEDMKTSEQLDIAYFRTDNIRRMYKKVFIWWADKKVLVSENDNRLIAIIRWVNGEDVFEVKKPKKWVIRSTGLTNDNEHYYVSIGEFLGLKRVINTFDLENATKFDTKEEAESWANAHQEVVEVNEL